jgi:hypothetical protein
MSILHSSNYRPSRADYALPVSRLGGRLGGSPWGSGPWGSGSRPSSASREDGDSPVLAALIVAVPPAIALWSAIIWGCAHIHLF